MAGNEEVLAATVREYFLKNGGRVKRNDLFDHFRGQLDKFDDLGTTKNRFGDIVDSLASLQSVEGEKYFVLKKARNGTTPVLLRRPIRQANQRKDKGVSLPASMRSFRFSAAEDAFGNFAAGDVSRGRSSSGVRPRAGFRSESHESGMRRNNSDTSIGDKSGQGNDSGLDSAASSLQSESPKGSRRQSSLSKNSEGDQISQNSGDTGINEDEQYYEHDVPSHVLTSLEKSWIISNMTGNKSEIICQLEEDPSIVKFKDFMMGYTALHWAAKQGHEDLVRLLADRGADVNIKSNGGYTPLHLASMHGKVDVINLLIDDYHANVHIRDHSGKEPKHVVTKNISEEIKQKLAEPEAAHDSHNTSGFSRYMDPKDSPKLKPKLKAGASFRFLKKQKKIRRSERPVIEHWDSSRQERLESTLESDEKELYKMQRSNSGSLFPVSFYSAKKSSQLEQEETGANSVDGGEDLEDPRRRSLSRSYPENEFRNLARISESESHVSGDEHRSPPQSLSTPSAVEGGQKVFDDVVDEGSVFENDPIKRRSYSENNLNKHAFQDELTSRLTMNKTSNGGPPSSAADGASAAKMERDFLKLKIDSSPEKSPLSPFQGKELQTFMTLPNKKSEVVTQRSSKPTSEAELNSELSSRFAQKQNGLLPSGTDTQQAGKTVDSLGKLDSVDGNRSSFDEEKQNSISQPLYNNNEVGSKFNNNYKQVSEMLTSNEQKNTEDEPTSPVRPARKKDKKLKKSQNVQEGGHDMYDFETVPTSEYPNTGSVKQDYSRGPRNQDYTRRKSDGFAIHKAYSEENILNQKEKLNTRRKSEGWGDRTGHEGFRTPGVDHTRPGVLAELRRNEGTRDEIKAGGFSNQREVSLDHPRRRSHEEAMKSNTDSVRRQSEGFVDQQRSGSFPDQRRLDSFSNQKEVSLDHPRRKTMDSLPSRHSEGFVEQQRSPGYGEQRKSWGSTGQQGLDGYSSQREVSLDHPRRKTMDSLPSRTNQTRHVLPEVLLDSSRHRGGAGNTESTQDSSGRVLPPYRPPIRPNYKPPPPPVAKQPPPYQDSIKGYSLNNPDSQVGYSHPPTRPNDLPYYSSENPSKNTPPGYSSSGDVTPIAPPRKHRKSSSEDTVYPPSEISPTAPPRKHRGSVPTTGYSYPPPNNISPTTSPRKYPPPNDYPPTDLSPIPPSRKNRASVPNSTQGPPPSRSSYPPSLPSSVPAPLPTYQRGEDYTFRPEVSFDHPTPRSQNYEPDAIDVIAARSYDQPEYETRSSNYDRSEREEYFPSREFEGQSSYYRRSNPDEYDQTGYGNYQPQSSTSRRSEGNEYNQADPSYPQTSTHVYPSDSSYNYPSEFRSNFEPTAASDHEAWSIRPRSAVDTTTRDQSPPEEVVVATSVPSEPERFTEYPEEYRSNRQEAPGRVPPIVGNMNESDFDRRNGTFTQDSYEDEFVIQPKFEGYTETNPVLPKYEGYTNVSRPETIVEPEFIVAKQMTAREVEGRRVGSREDINTLPATLAMEMKNKWVSNSSDGSNESTENKKYRMTSII